MIDSIDAFVCADESVFDCDVNPMAVSVDLSFENVGIESSLENELFSCRFFESSWLTVEIMCTIYTNAHNLAQI